jgi:hypothetical protein
LPAADRNQIRRGLKNFRQPALILLLFSREFPVRLKLTIMLFAVAAGFSGAAGEIAFNRDIRPLLAERCLECHGPAKSKSGLRLDQESSATKALKSGATAVNRLNPEQSELLRRVSSSAGENRMPPAESGKQPLSEKEIALLERWISEGARWEGHWAFNPIQRPPIPQPAFPELANNPIDAFIQKDLAAHDLRPSEKASMRILDRRLAFDLAGLPPFINAESWDEKIDAYLAAPSFGERMALWWLDLVRYADTEGYFSDSHRNVYPYRDYVIHSFNINKPFDQFTAEQLAGDLLANSGPEQKIASGYNRLILTTHETGANTAEYRARYAADRVRNLSSVWLGLTFGCAQCHDHKFDPISAGDFYRMSAFFADIDEEAIRPQHEVFPTITSPEYRAIVEKSEALRLQLDDSEIQCAQVLAEREFAETGRPPAYWPKSKRTDNVANLMRKKIDGRASAAEERDLAGYFTRHYRIKLHREIGEVMNARQKFERTAEPTLVTQRGAPETIRILKRGNWMDQSGPQVHAAFPEFLAPPHCKNAPNRADLAAWLTSGENPLTARVIVNRLWQLFFGEGLVRTLDDFGAQGEAPSNPDLLDYLASELIDSGWDLKQVVHLIVASHTYQQTSSASADLIERDPENRLFTRQNRFGLPAEFLRDNARAISGLLSRRADGPPVVPAGSVETDADREAPLVADTGERLYRRALFLYRKRSFLHPSLAAFNASTREECMSERHQVRAPQQALALLNSPDLVECARAFAERMYDSSSNNRERIKVGFNLALLRDPSEEERSVLLTLFEQQHKTFATDPISAAKFIRTSQLRWPTHIEAADLAAWTDVARAILNLDETNMRY